MKKLQYSIFSNFILLFYLNGCQAPTVNPIDHQQDIVFQVQTVNPRLIERPRTATGEGLFSASDKLYLTSPIQGRVDQVYVEEGDRVNEGDPLCLFDSRSLNGDLKVKNAELKEAESFLDAYQRELNAEAAEINNDPDEILFLDEETDPDVENIDNERRNEPIAPKKQVQSLNEETLRSRITAYENKIERINQEIIVIEEKLTSLTVNAPISGQIFKRHITDGSGVREDSPLFDIMSMNPMTLSFDLDQTHSSYIDKLVNIHVSPKDAPDIQIKGNIFYISPSINAASQTISLKAHIPNEKYILHDNQTAIAKITTRRMDKVLVVPEETIVEDSGSHFIYIVTKSMAYKTPVSIGNPLPASNEVEIDANIRVDDLIIQSGLDGLSHKSKVKIISQNQSNSEVGLDKQLNYK